MTVLATLSIFFGFTMFESHLKKITEIFNELTLLTCTYFMYIFSQFNPSPEDRYEDGYAYISLVLFNVGVLLIVMIVSSII